VTQVNAAPAFASAREALDMVRAGLGYLAAADAAQLPAATQAEVLRKLEQHDAVATAARAGFLAAFTAGAGPAGDGDYSAVSWLIHRTGITRGAAVGHSAWARRAAAHPRVIAALAAGQISESVGRVICLWTDKLPVEHRDAGDEQLLAAFAGGLGLADLASLFAEMYVRARGDLPDQDPGREFADREVKLATTIGGAGVMHGDLTAECAAAVAAVLDALSAPAGKEDDRSKGQRYHDALQEAMRRLTASGLLPERAGQPVKTWVHISLADLLLLDGDSALQQEWTERVRARWAARRAAASETGASDGAWLDGDAAAAITCDAAMAPIVTGDVDVDALEDLVRLCVELDKLRQDGDPQQDGDPRPGTTAAWAAIEQQVIGKAVDLLSGPGGLASFLRRRQLGARLGGPSLPLDIGYADSVPAGIRNAVLLRGPGAAPSPPAPARSTTPPTRPTAARPRCRTACCCARSTTRSSFTGGAGRWSSTRTGRPARGTRTRPRPCTATDPRSGRGKSGGNSQGRASDDVGREPRAAASSGDARAPG
jgi:hypothetical protein